MPGLNQAGNLGSLQIFIGIAFCSSSNSKFSHLTGGTHVHIYEVCEIRGFSVSCLLFVNTVPVVLRTIAPKLSVKTSVRC